MIKRKGRTTKQTFYLCHIVSIYKALKTIPPSSIEAERAFSTCGQFATRPRSRLNDDTLNALLITNKFYKKEKLLAKEKDLAKQKLSSKPAKAAETTETVEAAVQKSLTQNRQNIPRSSQQNDKSKIAKPPFYLHWDFRIF